MKTRDRLTILRYRTSNFNRKTINIFRILFKFRVDVLKEISSVNSLRVPYFDYQNQMTRSLDCTNLAITGDLHEPKYPACFICPSPR